jgi:hypothetical protein
LFDNISIAEKNPTNTLSKLLIAARVVKQPDLEEALKTAKRLDINLARALVMLKFASDNALDNPVKAEELVRKGKLSFELAVKALVLARQNSIDLEDAINVMGAVVTKTQTLPSATNALSELLLAGQMLTQEQLGQALQTSREANMGLGRTLTVNRSVTRWALAEALTTLLLVKESKISKEQAVNALRVAATRRASVTQILFELGQFHESSGESLKLSELIFLAGLLGESDYMECIEIEVTQERPFGQIVVELGLIDSTVLEAAGQLHDMVGSVLKPFQAAEALKQVRAKNITVYQAIAELQPPPQVPQRSLRLGDLVVESGLVQREGLEAALATSTEDKAVRIGKKLLAAGLLSETTLYASLRCYSLAREGLMSADQAILVLSACKTDNLSLEEALQKFAVSPPSRMQWSWS